MSRARAVMTLALVGGCLWAAQGPRAALERARPPAPAADRLGAGPLLSSVLTGVFRPALSSWLWLRAESLETQGRHDELQVAFRTLGALYANNEAARDFIGWRLAFNQRQEAPNPEVAWMWAREGLDMLADLDTEGARRLIAEWTLKQAGQNAQVLMRYAGKAWREERIFRRRFARWAEQRYGTPGDRFAVGLRALGDGDRVLEQASRSALLSAKVLDDWVRTGKTAHLEEAIAAGRALSARLAGEEVFAPTRAALAHEEKLLRTLAADGDPRPHMTFPRYDVFAAVWARAARARDPKRLRLAAQLLADVEADIGAELPEERRLVAGWLRHVEGDGSRPPLPFE